MTPDEYHQVMAAVWVAMLCAFVFGLWFWHPLAIVIGCIVAVYGVWLVFYSLLKDG